MSTTVTVRVRSVVAATPRTRIIRFDLNSGVFRYRAGQSVLVGAHGQPLRQPYSIAVAPEQAREHNGLELLVKVDAGGSPGTHIPRLGRGLRLDLNGPYGSFCFPENPSEQRFLFIAGGTGIAPLRAMMWHALLTRTADKIGLMYTARSPQDFAYLPELRRLAREGRILLNLSVTREAGGSWRGHRGRINTDLLTSMIDDPATLCFICGPPPLIDEIRPTLGQIGIAGNRIKTEEW